MNTLEGWQASGTLSLNSTFASLVLISYRFSIAVSDTGMFTAPLSLPFTP